MLEPDHSLIFRVQDLLTELDRVESHKHEIGEELNDIDKEQREKLKRQLIKLQNPNDLPDDNWIVCNPNQLGGNPDHLIDSRKAVQ